MIMIIFIQHYFMSQAFDKIYYISLKLLTA